MDGRSAGETDERVWGWGGVCVYVTAGAVQTGPVKLQTLSRWSPSVLRGRRKTNSRRGSGSDLLSGGGGTDLGIQAATCPLR